MIFIRAYNLNKFVSELILYYKFHNNHICKQGQQSLPKKNQQPQEKLFYLLQMVKYKSNYGQSKCH